MNALLLILSLIIVSLFIFNAYISSLRKRKLLELEKAYDEIEMFFIKNSIVMKNDYINLLKSFKNLTVNPNFLDIRVMVSIDRMIEKNKHRKVMEESHISFRKTVEELGDDFIPLFKKFDNISSNITFLSLFRFGFLYPVFVTVLKKGFSETLNIIKKMFKGKVTIVKNEDMIYYAPFDRDLKLC